MRRLALAVPTAQTSKQGVLWTSSRWGAGTERREGGVYRSETKIYGRVQVCGSLIYMGVIQDGNEEVHWTGGR